MRVGLIAPLLVAIMWSTGCDEHRASKLEEDVSSEADVRKQFGEPAQIIEKADGSKILAYPRQPEGRTNYEIIIDANGKMSSLRQLLTPSNIAKIQPGMDQAQVQHLLGKHARARSYAMKPQEVVWQWHFLDNHAKKLFEVTFDRDHKVLSTTISDDELQE